MKKALVFTLGFLVLLVAWGPQIIAGATLDQEQASVSVVPQALGSTIVVTSAAAAGPGTFRQALLEAQSGDTIIFDPAVFPPDNPTTIAVTSQLPDLTQGEVTVDASNAGVVLDGSQLPREAPVGGLMIASDGNVIQGLQILYFPGSGIWIDGGASNNLIGGSAPGEGNVISGNWDGMNIIGSDNTVSGNYIGTNATGTAALGNLVDGVWIGGGAQYNVIGGATEGERNIISGNGSSGVVIGGSDTMSNTVSGNYIGTNAAGTSAIGNATMGVSIDGDAQNNQVGGALPGERNLISGNNNDGVRISGLGTGHNTVFGNLIGTDATGISAIGNAMMGITIDDGAQNNQVGGALPGERNLISGNVWDGVSIHGNNTMSNTVRGNYIGTNAAGTAAIPNGNMGVNLGDGTQYNQIGGATVSERNLISGNGNIGVHLAGEGVMYNIVIGNYIGTDAIGTLAIGNLVHGVAFGAGAQNNRVGGETPGARNLISGNGDGVRLDSSGTMHNTVSGNYIGTDATGTGALGNTGYGVTIYAGAGPNIIGPENIIAHNGLAGVTVREGNTLGNTITGNASYDNGELGIENLEGGNTELPAPEVTSIGTRFIRGTTSLNATVEIFSGEEDEGSVFEGSTVASEAGDFVFRMPVGRFTGPHITLTATDAEGNTSQFSPPESPPAPRVTRELPDIVAPTQVSVEPKVIGTNLGLALFCVLFFGFTSNVFNSILEDYRDELVDAFERLIPRPFVGTLNKIEASLCGVTEKGRGGLLLVWLFVLLMTSMIESFLDSEVGLLSPERLGLLLTLFVSAVIVSALEWGADLYAHRRWASTMGVVSKVQWVGMFIAGVCMIVSRSLDFQPGYLYGVVGTLYLLPEITGLTKSGKRASFVLLTTFVGGFCLWIATSFLPAALVDLEPIFLTIFLLCLQGVFFQLFPLALTDGGDIWNWKKGVWFVFFSMVTFCFYHFLLNPNASEVQALQQNGVQTLLLLIGVFGLATFTLWLLLPFRLERKRASES